MPFQPDAKNPRSAIGKPVFGNGLRQVGRIVDVGEVAIKGSIPLMQVHWASGKLEWKGWHALGDLDDELARAEVRAAELRAARDRALR